MWQPPSYTPGTYTATAAGHNGDMTVEVVVDENTILSVTVTDHEETAGIVDTPQPHPHRHCGWPDLAVDLVGGATFSSKAIIQAVTTALKEAGADVGRPDERLLRHPGQRRQSPG